MSGNTVGRLESLKEALERSFADRKLDNHEKVELLVAFSSVNSEQRAFVRNRAFELLTEVIDEEGRRDGLRWLKGIIRALDRSEPEAPHCKSYFSPGDQCLKAILKLINGATNSLDICVFTISENRISDAIIHARDRGVEVRVITDNDKTADRGSDVRMMLGAGIQIRMDRTRHHMHHKFMLVDEHWLATGSFNWTRSASDYNHENILILNEAATLRAFSHEFERLWGEFSNF